MSKEVDNGIKKFFIIFLGFIVVLNVLSVFLFSHSLFYYFSNSISIDDEDYNYILNLSIVGKCFIPIILICFFLFVKFTIKQVKKYRRYIYPIMYIVFLFILEFGVLSFFDFSLPFLKDGCFGVTIPENVCVRPYIPLFYPFSLLSIIVYSGLMTIGNIFDNKSVGRKNSWYGIVVGIILSSIILILIEVIVIGILSNI